MAVFPLRDRESCRWDMVALGEVMLRLDPGAGRIATARTFRAWEGGGEYNVARGLKRCFGLETTIVAALADNAVGHLIEDLMYQGGVDQSHVRWYKYDGVGWGIRNALNFTERGFGPRAPLGVSDRGHSATSQFRPGDVEWRRLFEQEGARWFHTGGIFAALGASTASVAEEAIATARASGTAVSYDLNFRESLWQARGGRDKAREVNQRLAGMADVIFGNEEDYEAALGLRVSAQSSDYSELDVPAYEKALTEVLQRYPTVKVAAVTLRHARSATRNDWTALCATAQHTYTSQTILTWRYTTEWVAEIASRLASSLA